MHCYFFSVILNLASNLTYSKLKLSKINIFQFIFPDEKEKYDPLGFRDAIISGLDKCSNDFEAISRFLHSTGNKLDYRRYGEVLFDILIAGGMLGNNLRKPLTLVDSI